MKHPFLAAILLAAFAAGCQEFAGTSGLPRPTREMMKPIYPAARAEIDAGDSVAVKFTRHPEFDTHGVVEMDGTFTMPLLGPLQFAGKTTSEMRDELIAAYSKYLKNADIAVTTEKPGDVVYVAGATRSGGALPYRANMTVAMALAASVPDTVEGDVSGAILVRKDEALEAGYRSYLVNGDFASGDARNVYLMPGDIVIVPRKGIALAGDAVQLYVRDLVPPAMNLGYGFEHEVHAAR